MARVDVKPLTHWAIYKGYKLRFGSRTPARVTGVLTDAGGSEHAFTYAPDSLTLHLAGKEVRINAYGWELERRAPSEIEPETEPGAGSGAAL
jgi:hypothetical protein